MYARNYWRDAHTTVHEHLKTGPKIRMTAQNSSFLYTGIDYMTVLDEMAFKKNVSNNTSDDLLFSI